MAYEKQEWKNGKDGDTPLEADRLNHMEDGIKDAYDKADNVKDGEDGKDLTYDDMSDDDINDLASKVADKLKDDNDFQEDVAGKVES